MELNGRPKTDPADLDRLRAAKEELAEVARQAKLADQLPPAPTVPPAPAAPLGQQVQVLRDRMDRIEQRLERAAKVVQDLIVTVKKIAPKPAVNGVTTTGVRK